VWNHAFEGPKRALIDVLVLVQPNFKKPFCFNVDWSPKSVGAILSQKESKLEKMMVYVNKNLTLTQRKFHPMEGECYTLI